MPMPLRPEVVNRATVLTETLLVLGYLQGVGVAVVRSSGLSWFVWSISCGSILQPVPSFLPLG